MTAGVKNLSASIRQRLKNKADTLGVPFNELLQRYAIERFLYRLGESKYRDVFVLKGAQMLVVWRNEFTRATMDVDFLGFTENSLENLETIVKTILMSNPKDDDALWYDPQSVRAVRIKEGAEYEGVRVTFSVKLEPAVIHIQIDVGFNESVFPKPLDIHYPSLLGLPEPNLRAYSRESVIAEKFEAMVKLGGGNSRMKDFFDVWLLSQQFPFCGPDLSQAVRATFERRGTILERMPITLHPVFEGQNGKQIQWSAFLRRSRIDSAPPQFADVAASIAAFLEPVAEALARGTVLDAAWPTRGPWEIL